MATTLPSMTLAQLRAAVRQRADQVHSQFVADAELDGYVNESLYSLRDLLVTIYGADYYVEESTATTDGTAFVDLPSDFFKLLGVDLLVDSSRYVSLKQFNVTERNRSSTALMPPLGTNVRYRLRANKLWLTPTPQSGQTLRILYVPRLKPLIEPVTITVSSVQTGDEVGISEYATVTAGSDFDIGATDEATASNIIAALEDGDYPVSGDSPNYSFTQAGNVIYVTQEDVVNGSREWTSSNATTLAIGGGSPGTFPSYLGRDAPPLAQTTSDGIGGWLEYVILDAAIKCMAKEETDSRVLQAQIARVEKRINDSASNRDAGAPPTVADTSRTGAWGDLDDGYFFTRY